MILCGDLQNKGLSEGIAKKLSVEIFYPEVDVFPDSEQRVRVNFDVLGQTVYLVKSITSPVDSAVMQLAFLVDALKNKGVSKVIGIIPYIPYMRADHIFRTGEAIPLEVVIKMIQDAGLSEIIIVDPHSIKIPELFSIPIYNLSALKIFCGQIKKLESDNSNITIVSPDMGGIRRLDIVDGMLGGVNKVIINKDRDYSTGDIKVAEYKGDVKGKCFIIDDIISTGKTIAQAVETLVKNGAEKVYVFATHPVFSDDASKILQNSSADKIFVTDSIPVAPDKKFEKLEILSVSSLISNTISAE